MKSPFRIPTKVRIVFSKLGSFLLLFQKTPLVQILLPEARVLGTSGMGEVVKWSVAAIAGLGAFDTVAGATVISQVTPSPNSTTVPAKTGNNLTFLVQVTGAPSSKAGSWQVVGTLPPGLVHANAVNSSTDSITGVPTATGTYPITIKAWENSGYRGGAKSQAFSIVVSVGSGATVTAPAISGQPASATINSGGTSTMTLTASGTTPTFQWYRGNKGATANPVAGATSASFTTPPLTTTTSYWARAANSAGSADSNNATVTVIAMNFAGWASQNGVSGGVDGDSDHDGIPNLMEYALQTNPAGSDGSTGTFVGRTVSFTKRALAVSNGDVTYAIEASPSLVGWTPVIPTVNSATTISYTIPSGSPKVFARLKATNP